MMIKPLNDWAVIVPSEAAERTAGGLYIPDSAREKPAEGVVEAIGPGAYEEVPWKGKREKEKKKERKYIPTSVKPGERVLYERYAGTKIAIGGLERVLVRERSILGIFTGAASPADPRPLMLPEKTATPGDTSLATLAMSAITAHAPARPLAGRSAEKKTAAKTAKKAAKKKSEGKTGTEGKKAAKKKSKKKTKVTAKKRTVTKAKRKR
jgi:chaperonin GroES